LQDQSSPGGKQGEDLSKKRTFPPEAGARINSLENVVDWSKIRQKYWARKVRRFFAT